MARRCQHACQVLTCTLQLNGSIEERGNTFGVALPDDRMQQRAPAIVRVVRVERVRSR